MNMFDEARSISVMLKMRSMTQIEIAKKLGVSQPYIANKLRLLSYSPECERKITDYALSERHARAILRLREDELRLKAIETVKERGLTVYECEGLVDMLREEELPSLLKHQEPSFRLGRFIEAIDESVLALRGLGFDISRRTSYHGGRTYITLCVDENKKYRNF